MAPKGDAPRDAALAAPVLSQKIKLGIYRDDPVGIDGVVAIVIVAHDVIHVHRRSNTGCLV